MRMQVEMLCLDCFRLVWFDAVQLDGFVCPSCGGDCYADNYSRRILALLRSGERRGHVLGLPVDIADWTPDGGCKPAEIPQW